MLRIKFILIISILALCSPCITHGATEGFIPLTKQGEIPPIRDESETGRHGLCGLNCLYFILQICDDSRYTYDDLLKSFPFASQRGVNLKELRAFFEKNNYHCKYEELSEVELVKRYPSLIGIALIVSKDKINNHLVVKMPQEGDSLRVVDLPHIAKVIEEEKLSNVSQMILLVSKKSIGSRNFIAWGTIPILLLASAFFFFKSKTKQNLS